MLRGKETDIIKIYNYVTPVIQLANGGQMLNRGYWDKDAKNPLQAQHQFCKNVTGCWKRTFNSGDSLEHII